MEFTCMDTRVFMALLFNACITSSNNSLNVSNFTKCQHKHHTLTILTIMEQCFKVTVYSLI